MADEQIITVENTPARSATAMEIVKKNMAWSVAAGLLPFPVLDLVAITSVQVKVIKELAHHYNKTYRQDLAKSSVISLLGGLGSVTLGKVVAASSVRFIPVLGPIVAATSLSAISAGVTYAVGKVYIQHFETGGTMLDFDPVKAWDCFRKEYTTGLTQPVVANG